MSDGQTHYPAELARDAGFLLLAGRLLVRPGTLMALDGWLPADTTTRSPTAE